MKTAEVKAREYADGMAPVIVSGTEISYTINVLNEFAQKDYLAGYMEAMRWRDPKEAPQNTDMLVKYTMADDIFNYTCLEKDRDDTWHWWGEEWDVDKYPIIGWRPIEEGG